VSDIWTAPTAAGPVHAAVAVPGSKSVTNRALVLAALAGAPTTLRGPLRARDTELMASALRALGTGVEDLPGPKGAAGDWLVSPRSLSGPAVVDCGLAGTVMRFVPPVAALATGEATFDGDPHARSRPMAPVIAALRDLGVSIDDAGRGGLPFTVHGRGAVAGGKVDVDASRSSQFVSALLLAGCRYDAGVQIRCVSSVGSVGSVVPSLPHIDMTVAMLDAAGVRARRDGEDRWTVEPGLPRGGEVSVEPDTSNAFPFAAAALATGGEVTLRHFPLHSPYQPVGLTLSVLEQIGAQLTQTPDGLIVDGSAGVRGADLDLGQVPELVTVVAALACLADSPTVIRGVAHVRGHETDRLAALTKELGRLGADVRETDDGLSIRPSRLHGGVFETYADHRLATAAALLGLVVDGVGVVDVATTAKTLPDFVGLWTRMLQE
jgi:3-phosphoshikimate 1-carboxyvinyltransferase